jgi:hypothetical protein
MRRRELLASLAAAVWPLTTSAQQARTPVHDWQNRVADPRTCFWLVFMSLGPECELAVRGRVGRGVDEGVESTPCTVPFQAPLSLDHRPAHIIQSRLRSD